MNVKRLCRRLGASIACAAVAGIVMVGTLSLGPPNTETAIKLLFAVAIFIVPLIGCRWFSAFPSIAALGVPGVFFATGRSDIEYMVGFNRSLVFYGMLFGIGWFAGWVGLMWRRRAGN